MPRLHAKEQAQAIAQVADIVRAERSIYGNASDATLSILRKALLDVKAQSKQGAAIGLRPHLFNKVAVRDFSDFNPHHSACIEAKKSALLGLGFKSEKVAKTLNPLCEFSFMDVANRFAQDYFETGDGYMEIVTPEDDEQLVTGIHHMPSADAHIYLEDKNKPTVYHYEIVNTELGTITIRRFARFGDRDDMVGRLKLKGLEAGSVSQLIHWRSPNSRSRWYGYPEWFSGVPSIELVQAMTQNEFNFFFNNGVPEYLLFVLGSKIPTPDWNKLVGMLRANQGVKNTRKSQAVNLDNPNVSVQVEKLGANTDSSNSPFAINSEITAANIVTAHGVPPILAGIQLPGKLGAQNEGPNAIMLFQLLKIGPAQVALSQLLASTFAADGVRFAQPTGGEQRLTEEDFIGKKEDKGNGFNTVMEAVNLQSMNTLSTMKDPLAGAGGRDLSQGKLTSADGRKKTGGLPSRGAGVSQAKGRGIKRGA